MCLQDEGNKQKNAVFPEQNNKPKGSVGLPFEGSAKGSDDRQKAQDKAKAERQQKFDESHQKKSAKTEQSRKDRQQRMKQKEQEKEAQNKQREREKQGKAPGMTEVQFCLAPSQLLSTFTACDWHFHSFCSTKLDAWLMRDRVRCPAMHVRDA